ncbi:AAA family ATPase [Candidatus Daviesbacteria bacterium]|nr:AAA family ATPase [Candidatus Daviesbacteria bacterium]
MTNFLLVVTGKTASGKDTVISALLKRFPEFKKVITTTSRAPRAGETDGFDYNFISKEEFEKKINNGDFIEYVDYAGNLYGTEKSQLEQNQPLIWRIDPSRAGKVRELIKDREVLVIYLTVDDETVLQRLTGRGLGTKEIEARMNDDKTFWETYKDKYDVVVENTLGQLNQTIDKIIEIIENQRS